MNSLKESVKAVVEKLEQGIEITQEDIDNGYVDSCMYEVGDMLSGFDYLVDVLDIEYMCSADKAYRGARILVAFGGPNIWINTRTKKVEGSWWGESFTMPYETDSFDLDECLEELFNS